MWVYMYACIYKLPFNLSHMPEPGLVPHPTHLGASPGSALGSGRALEHDVGDSVGPCCPRHVPSPPTLRSTSAFKKIAPVVQCVSSITPHSVSIICPLPGLLHHAVHNSLCFCLSRAWGSFVSFACACGAVHPIPTPASSKMQCIVYIHSMRWKTL